MREPSSSFSGRVLYPYTNAVRQENEGSLQIVEGSGIRVFDNYGRSYLEGTAGLWCVSLGFSETRLIEAAYKQMQKLPYYQIFNQRSNSVAHELSKRLAELLPSWLSTVFFANSGSEANDTAIKICWYYQNAIGRSNKKKIIAHRLGYHGSTVATASLTGIDLNHIGFDLPLTRVLHVSCPYYYRCAKSGETEGQFVQRLAHELDSFIEAEGADTVAAFITEPVLGGGGVIVPPNGYFEAIQGVLNKHDVLLIADEIICGFGRTGMMFGSEKFRLRPDIMTFGKALSSSYVPISAMAVSDRIWEIVKEMTDEIGSFGHGFTTSGHPVCCAVALETLDIYRERNILEHVHQIEPMLQLGLREFSEHPLVGDVRGVGLLGAVELVKNRASREPFDRNLEVGLRLSKHAMRHGALLRPLGDTVSFCPPLISTPDEIHELMRIFRHALNDIAREVSSC